MEITIQKGGPMMDSKIITLRLSQPLYEKLCNVAEENMELPAETVRRILRENLGEKVIIAPIIEDTTES